MNTKDIDGEGRSPAWDLELRGRAEDWERAHPGLAAREPAEAVALLHELRVHQIELEMQNEELQRAHDELEASRMRFVELYDQAPVGYVTLDDEGRIVEANLRVAALLGVDRASLIGQYLAAFVRGNDQDALHVFRRRLSADAAHDACEVRLFGPAEEPQWVRLEATTFRTADGEHLWLHTSISDISALRRSQEALREREAVYGSIVEQAVDAIGLVDGETGRFIEVNDAACTQLGYARDELLAMGIGDIEMQWPAGDAIEALAALQERGADVFETRHRRRDGEIRDVRVSASAVDVAGRRCLSAIWWDVTAQKQADEALRESEQRYRVLFEDSRSVMLIVDPASGAIVDANRSACAWYGWSREELLAMNIAQINTLPAAAIQAEMATARANEEGVFHFKHRLADGTVRDVDIYSGPLEVRGKTLLYSLVHDVTDREHATAELMEHRLRMEQLVAERTKELSEANRILEERSVEVARSRQNFDAFFNTIDDLLFVLDAGGNMIHVNETVCRRLGYSEAELLGRPVLDVHPPLRRDEAGRIVAAMLAGEAAFCPVPVVTKDGAEIPVETRVVFGVWNGEPALFGVTKDVSALKLSEEKFSSAFHSAPVLMAISTVAEGRFVDVNEVFLTTLGLARQGVIGRTSAELGLFDDPHARAEVLRAVAEQGRARNVEIDVRHSEGGVVHGLFSADPIVVGGEPCVLTTMLDITERKRAEAAVRESEEKFRMVAEFTYDWETWRAPDGTFRYVSPSCERVTGHTAAEFLADPDLTLQITHPDDRAKVRAHHDSLALQAQDRPLDLEFRIVTPDGETRWISQWSTAVYGEDGQWLGRRVSNRDVTANKQAADRLRASEQQLANAVAGSGVGLWDWNPQTGAETFSEHWAAIAGYTLAELAPTSIETWRRLTHPDDLQRADELLEEHFRGESAIYTCEERVRHKDGHWVWVLERGTVSEWDEEGRPVRMTGTALDITERKQAEEALRQLTDRLSLAARAGGVGVWDWDLVTDVLTWDEQMFALYGITHEQFSGAYEAWQAGLHPDDRERGDAEIQAALRGEREFDTEFRVLWPDGSVRDIRALARVQRDASGRAMHLIGTNWDITAIKQAEERLQDANRQLQQAVAQANGLAVEAQAATTAKSVFLAHMSHEIRTPLNAIIGFAQLMQGDPQLTAQQSERVAIINRSGEHLLALLSDVLELSKVESGRQSLDETSFDLRKLLDDLAIVFRARAEASGLTFAVDGANKVPRFVTADQAKLRQILTNLLGNAVRLTESGGVRLHASTSKLVAGRPLLVISVEDTGPGIAADEMQALFAPFEQTSSGHRHGTGTGLGLAISRQFARIMGGELDVASEVGHGSTFRVAVPFGEGSEEASAPDADARRVLGLEAGQPDCGVLVVDGDDDSRTLLLELLGEIGFAVAEADDGLEAREALRRWRPRLVIVADSLPDAGVAEAVRKMRRSAAGKAAKVVVLAAGATDENRDLALAAGADAFMPKPFRTAELLELVRVLTGVRYVYVRAAPEAAAATAGPTREMMAALPRALRDEIRRSAVRARHARLLELADAVTAADPEAGARYLEAVSVFDYASVLSALGEEPA